MNLIDDFYVEKITNIIREGQLVFPIHVSCPAEQLQVGVNALDDFEERGKFFWKYFYYNTDHDFDGEPFNFKTIKQYLMISMNTQKNDVYLTKTKSSYDVPLDMRTDTNIPSGTASCDFELRESLQGKKNILIKKKISKLTGPNTIVRIDHDRQVIKREEKVKRRDYLVKMLNSDIIEYDGETYMVISTIPLSDLNSPGKEDLLFTKIVRDMLLYFCFD